MEYDPGMRYVCMDFPVPSDVQARLPCPRGYENTRWLFGTLPVMPGEQKSAMGGRYERDRRKLFLPNAWPVYD